MSRLKTFFKRHVIWVVMLAVAIPLLIILVVQYRSLVQLERTLPVANKAWMRKYLVTIGTEVQDFYRGQAEQALAIPPGSIGRDRIQTHSSDLAPHFKNNPTKLAKRFFIGFTGERRGGGYYSLVQFYNPVTNQFDREPGSPQWRAAHEASGHWLYHSITNASFLDSAAASAGIMVSERDPENRIITKPFFDKKAMVVGVAGMVVDEAYLKDEVIPRLIESTLSKFFPDDCKDVIVTLHDKGGNLMFASQPIAAQSYEVGEPLPFIFKDLRLKIAMRYGTEEQGARRVFAINFSLTILMTGLLIGGIIMALRTASREMKLSQMKADFVSNVSHELRTPLASIRVFGEFLRLGRFKDPQKIREYGEFIETESRRLTQLINNILDFSRIESGRKTYNFEKADVSEIVAEALKAFEVRLSQDGFKIVYETPQRPLPVTVVDPDAIAQAFVNLLDNAVKYSGSSKEILVRVAAKDDYITVSVTDHGYGIAQEEKDKIFEKFYRVSTGLVHDVKGSGLGLSIVKHIIEAHNGQVTVNSKPGSGSTFTLSIPAKGYAGTPTESPKSADSDKAPLDLKINYGDR